MTALCHHSGADPLPGNGLNVIDPDRLSLTLPVGFHPAVRRQTTAAFEPRFPVAIGPGRLVGPDEQFVAAIPARRIKN
jgi:hypothetical protein